MYAGPCPDYQQTARIAARSGDAAETAFLYSAVKDLDDVAVAAGDSHALGGAGFERPMRQPAGAWRLAGKLQILPAVDIEEGQRQHPSGIVAIATRPPYRAWGQ